MCVKMLDLAKDNQWPSNLVYSKTDAIRSFHLLPIQTKDPCWLVMKCLHPISGKIFFFVDKCLPFGASRSCALTQKFSDALAFITQKRTHFWIVITNYLDDFLFISYTRKLCNEAMSAFLLVCTNVGYPISEEKTEWATQCIVFLGMLLDGSRHVLVVPEEKKYKAIGLLKQVKSVKKITIKKVQELTGLLNFLARAVIPGQMYTRNMYNKLKICDKQGKPLKQYHHVSVDTAFKSDCEMWLDFLTSGNQCLCQPFVDINAFKYATDLAFWTDASAKSTLGFGGVFSDNWIVVRWGEDFINDEKPSIEFLELFPLCAGVLTWANRLRDNRFIIYYDNQAVVAMVNNSTSTCNQCMKLIRILVLDCMKYNRRIHVRYISSKSNFLADSLSRMEFKCFWSKAPPSMQLELDQITNQLWPVEKIWFS